MLSFRAVAQQKKHIESFNDGIFLFENKMKNLQVFHERLQVHTPNQKIQLYELSLHLFRFYFCGRYTKFSRNEIRILKH